MALCVFASSCPLRFLRWGRAEVNGVSEKVRVAVVGCGAISPAYFKMARQLPVLEMAACADLNRAAAEARAAEFEVPRVCAVEELLADPSIEIVLNLTVPKAHAP